MAGRVKIPAPPAGVTVEIGRLAPLGFGLEAWRARAVHGEIEHEVAARTRVGWPVRLVYAADGETAMLVALYQFFDHGAVAVARCPRAVVAAAAEGIEAWLLEAQPEWDPPEWTLADLWRGLEAEQLLAAGAPRV